MHHAIDYLVLVYSTTCMVTKHNYGNMAATYLQLLDKFVYFIFLMASFDRRDFKYLDNIGVKGVNATSKSQSAKVRAGFNSSPEFFTIEDEGWSRTKFDCWKTPIDTSTRIKAYQVSYGYCYG